MNSDCEGTTIDMDLNRHLDEMNDVDVEEGDIIKEPINLGAHGKEEHVWQTSYHCVI